MSIWTSIHLGADLVMPCRCNYCGELVTECVCTGHLGELSDTPGPETIVDVATARSWHQRIRFSLDTHERDFDCLMSVDEARLLTEMLTAAIAHIEAER